ncbi:MAG: sensor histidine kinase [Clostridia bacterium]|nr:sensor histidine kinase [Clostridia bacterium]
MLGKIYQKLIKYRWILKLRNQLLIYLILVAFLPVFGTSIYFDYIMRDKIKEDIITRNHMTVAHMIEGIDRRIEDANKFADWLCRDSNLLVLLRRSPQEARRYDSVKKDVIKKIQEQFEYNSVGSHIPSLFIIGDNGIDIRNGIEAALIDYEIFTRKPWFIKGRQANGRNFWGSMTNNYTKITLNPQVIPMMRTINDLSTGQSIGNLVICFDEQFFSNIYREFSSDIQAQIYLVDLQGNIFYTNQFENQKINMNSNPIFTEIINRGFVNNTHQNAFEIYFKEQLHLVTYQRSSKTGWLLIQAEPMNQIEIQSSIMKEKGVMWGILMIIACVLLALILSIFFTKPLVVLNEQVHQIARGDFNQTINLQGNNEISELAESINKMKVDLEVLLREGLDKEKEKRILEIKMLQSQITPHFLYNTLNSIKVMAALQGAQGIEKMTGSLGKLLKASLGGFNEHIILEEELEILNDYIYIQKIRYKGKVQFSLNIKDEELLRCKIIKFILQPLVENAIFHGIAPKEDMGEIVLSVYEHQNLLVLEIWDDGIGMSGEVIRKINEDTEGLRETYDHGMGLYNINQRIKLIYGEKYGMHFESLIGEYTKITIYLPIEKEFKDCTNI